jgi:hypothetical protein
LTASCGRLPESGSPTKPSLHRRLVWQTNKHF